MFFRLSQGRRTSNLFGILFSLLVLILFFSSIPFFVKSNNAIAYALFFSALGLNYLITLVLSLELIHSPTREDLFINFCLFIFLMFPALGIFFYFLLGFDSLHKDERDIYTKVCTRYRRYERGFYPLPSNGTGEHLKVFSYNFLKHHTNVYRNVRVEVLSDAYRILKEMTLLIEGAKRYVHMEFYMFSDGFVFEHLLQLLKKQAERGVEVRLIIDYAGNANRLKRRSLRRLREAGIQVRIFNPFLKINHLWWQFRNHNKVLVVDNEYAVCGSCNISDEYFNITKKYFQTTELSVKLAGDIVGSVSALFLSHWDLCNNRKSLAEPEFDENKCSFYFKNQEERLGGSGVAQLLDNSPIGSGFIIRDNLMQLIFGAKRKIVISTPYFYPPKELVNALKLVKSEGVEVKILVPKNPDLKGFFSTLNRQPLETLIEHGVEVYEYFGFNHEKVMIIDEEIVYVGSYNWDYRALYLNFEHALLMKCEKLANTIGNFVDRQFENSHIITISDLKKIKHFYWYSLFIKLFKPFL